MGELQLCTQSRFHEESELALLEERYALELAASGPDINAGPTKEALGCLVLADRTRGANLFGRCGVDSLTTRSLSARPGLSCGFFGGGQLGPPGITLGGRVR